MNLAPYVLIAYPYHPFVFQQIPYIFAFAGLFVPFLTLILSFPILHFIYRLMLHNLSHTKVWLAWLTSPYINHHYHWNGILFDVMKNYFNTRLI